MEMVKKADRAPNPELTGYCGLPELYPQAATGRQEQDFSGSPKHCW
jgi:hypothetical protein